VRGDRPHPGLGAPGSGARLGGAVVAQPEGGVDEVERGEEVSEHVRKVQPAPSPVECISESVSPLRRRRAGPGQHDGAVTRETAAPGRTGRPPVTSRAEILAAARRIIDRDGWEKLTVRRLAADLGVGTTTLYHHVRDKQDLLVQLLTDHAARTPRPDLPAEPRDRVVAAAVAMHDVLVAWPWAAEVLTVDGLVGRLGEPALWMVETVVAGAVDHGCTADQAVDVFRNIWYFTVGETLVRARSAVRRPAEEPPADFFGGLDPARLPRLAALGDRWPVLAARDTYREALEAIVDGLLARAAAAP
jgi:AcrR family transcriptional regulator